MSGTSGLRTLLLEWVNGNDEDANDWLAELDTQSIRDIDDLAIKAKYGDSWESLLDSISPILSRKLSIWYETAPELESIQSRGKRKVHFETGTHFYKSDMSGLGDLVLAWANGNEEEAKDWLDELDRANIIDKKSLVLAANYVDSWEGTLGKLTEGLRVHLIEWHETAPEMEDIRRKRKSGVDDSRMSKYVKLDPIDGSLFVDPSNEEYKRYMEIASSLTTNSQVVEVLNKLDNISKESSDTIPFIAILSSSGTGKTQFAFNMMSASSNVRYLLSSPPGDNGQRIYKAFGSPSRLLSDCVSEDVKTLNGFGISDILPKKLFIFGFIEKLLKFGFECTDNVQIEPTMASQVSTLVAEKKPIVVLDEFMSISNGNVNYLRLLINSFRAVKIPVVVMGTRSAVSNLVEFVAHMRGGGSYPWCFLYTKLPPVSLSCMPFTSSQNVLGDIARKSRPLFVEIMEDFLRESGFNSTMVLTCDFIDQLLKRILDSTVARKPIFANEFGRHGQIYLFLNAYYPGIGLKATETGSFSRTPLVNYHFANLRSDEDPVVINSSGNLKHSIKFIPVSCYPSIEEDLLLYLCFMGGKGNYTFRDATGRRISYIQSRNELFESVNARKFVVQDANGHQISNDGAFYEAVLSSIVCAASHYGGLQGIEFQQFLEEILREIAPDIKKVHVDLSSTFESGGMLHFLKDFRVPFLSPLNMKWPEWVFRNVDNICLGNLERSKNKERIDLSSDCGISGECKDHTNRITSSVMCEILLRVPDSSRVHLVLTNELLKGRYFTGKTTFNDVVAQNTKLSSCVFYSVDEVGGLARIPGLDNSRKPDTAVLFILIKGQN